MAMVNGPVMAMVDCIVVVDCVDEDTNTMGRGVGSMKCGSAVVKNLFNFKI
jgi:hypothetical protein